MEEIQKIITRVIGDKPPVSVKEREIPKEKKYDNSTREYLLTESSTDPNCPKCGGRGIFILPEDNSLCSECDCKKRVFLEKRFKNCKIPEGMLSNKFTKFQFQYYNDKYIDKSMDVSFRQIALKSIDYAKRYASALVTNKTRKGLYIFGPVGSGKTFLACCIVNYVIENSEINPLFLIVPEFLQRLKFSINNPKVNEEAYMDIQKACEVPLLVLDDFGSHSFTRHSIDTLYNIIARRTERKLPVIITSNLDIEDPPEEISGISQITYATQQYVKNFKESEITAFMGKQMASKISELCIPLYLSVQEDIRKQMQKTEVEKLKKQKFNFDENL